MYYISMNWVAVSGEDNNFSIHSQRLLPLLDLCILSFSNMVRNSYKLKSDSATPHSHYGISDIVSYFRSFFHLSISTESVLPYWISDLLYNHAFQDEDCPMEFIQEFFSDKVCSLSKVTLGGWSVDYTSSRITHLKSYTLSSLDFSKNICISDKIFEELVGTEVCQSLKTLKLQGCMNFHRVSTLFCFTNLIELDLSENTSLIWKNRSCLGALALILSSLEHLQILDLHFTNFFLHYSVKYVDYSSGFLNGTKLQELYLYMNPIDINSFSVVNPTEIYPMFDFLLKLTSLTHLDISGWPLLEEMPGEHLTTLSKKLTFFGLYDTPITDKAGLMLYSEEITGLCEEKYLIFTVARYYKSDSDYLKKLFLHVFDNIMSKSVIYSEDVSLRLVPLVLDSLDHYLTQLPPSQYPPSTWNELELMIGCTACLFALEYPICGKMSDKLVRRSIETSITLLHRIGVDEIHLQYVGQLAANACGIYSLFIANPSFKQSHQTMICVLSKFSLSVVDKVCDYPIHSSMGIIQPRLLDITLGILCAMLLDSVQKAYIGIDLRGIDILMRLIDRKITQSSIDDDLCHASNALMHITYLCLPNCLRLSKREHSELLVRVLGENSEKKELIGPIMDCIENIAEFCLQDESAAVSSQLLAPVVTVLQKHTQYNQDAISCAIAFTAYFAMGHEKWGWEESGGETLSLAVEVIGQLDYRIARSVFYNTLDFLVECLGAKDKRILLCSIWIICNLVYEKPEYYLDLLSEEAIKTIQGILSSHLKDSIYHKLSQEIIRLHEITRKCTEFK